MKTIFVNCGKQESEDTEITQESDGKKSKKNQQVEVFICNHCPNFNFGKGACKFRKAPAINHLTHEPIMLPAKDEKGKILHDENGKVVLKPKMEPYKIPTTITTGTGYIAYIKPVDCTFDWDDKKKESVADPASNPAGAAE